MKSGQVPLHDGCPYGGPAELFGRTRDAEFVYGTSTWLPELVELRAGGLIPIARQYPGAREFADLSFLSASGYGACQILVEATRRVGSLDGERLRDHKTVFGGFRVDRDGVQIAHKRLLFQWQDGKKVTAWPEDLAPGKPRFPTPPWLSIGAMVRSLEHFLRSQRDRGTLTNQVHYLRRS